MDTESFLVLISLEPAASVHSSLVARSTQWRGR